VIVPASDDLYTYEADTVAAHVADRQAPQMSWDDTRMTVTVGGASFVVE